MKKIIEIASEFLDYDVFAGERTNEIMSRLKPALAEYKRLSETPITEDWLKEHGFILEAEGYVFYDESKGTQDQYYALVQLRHNKEQGARVIEIRTMWRTFYAEQGTFGLSYLLDALELCGITMED